MGTVEGKKNAQKFNFRNNSFYKRKIALGCKFQSNFVYSLKQANEIACFLTFARHGRALTGESPEHAQVVGNV